MADTRAATGLTPQQWDDKFFTEYFQQNRFSDLMGTDEMSVIQVKENLSKGTGDSLTFALVNKLTNEAVTGTNMLEGNEEDISSRSFRLYIEKYRNAVRIPEMEEIKSAIDLREAGRAILMDWAKEHTKDLVIDALEGINGVNYADASESQKDAWLVDNVDRVQFGALRSNGSSLDHSAALANIDNTADKLTANALTVMKRLALAKRTDGSPRVRPVRDQGNGKRYYVAFAHPLCFRDLRTDSTITQAQREVSLQMENSRLFEGGDILWDNIIVKEIDDFNTLTGVGASSIDVGRCVLLGAQAVGVAYGKRWRTRTKEFDYGDKYGIAVDGIYGCKKMQFGKSSASDTGDLVDHGTVTGYFAAVADA
jgi:N4-gp56 family major capsid protein